MPPADPTARPVALTIAGSDSSGGAGLQADLKTFAALRCTGATAVTAVTAQNTRGVQAASMLDPALVAAQIDSVADGLTVAATKTGMLGTAATVHGVADAVGRHGLSPLVVDPVMIAKSRDALIDDDAIDTLTARLLPLARLVTPNRHEAARLVGFDVDTAGDAARAAEMICLQFGAKACVVKGIRAERAGRTVALDVFFDTAGDPAALARPWHAGCNTHGSGCIFSAALTAFLAHGQALPQALEAAKTFIDAELGSREQGLGPRTS